jgi:molecular chaperone GrpE (heat shock protein)
VSAPEGEPLGLARELMRSLAAERRGMEKELQECAALFRELAEAFVDHLEVLEGLADAAPAGEGGESLRLAVRAAWEKLGSLGIGFDAEVGAAFDPARHRVVKDLTPGASGGERRVVRVLSRGITSRGRLLRPASVVVGRQGKTS